MERRQTGSPSARRHRRDLEWRRHARWRASGGLAYRRGYAASCLCSSCPHQSHAGRCNGPRFRGLDALAVNDRGSRAGGTTRLLAALHIERLVKAVERAVIAPQVEIIIERRARRQILRNRSPLTARAQNIHQAVDHFAFVDMAPVAATYGRRDHRRNMSPFGICQVAWIPQRLRSYRARFSLVHTDDLHRISKPQVNHKRFISIKLSPDGHLSRATSVSIAFGPELLGEGGEGAVFDIKSSPQLVAKGYHKPLEPDRTEKMLLANDTLRK